MTDPNSCVDCDPVPPSSSISVADEALLSPQSVPSGTPGGYSPQRSPSRSPSMRMRKLAEELEEPEHPLDPTTFKAPAPLPAPCVVIEFCDRVCLFI